MIDKTKRAIDLDASEVYELIKEAVSEIMPTMLSQMPKQVEYGVGLDAIMQVVGCKKTKACKLHMAGFFDAACSGIGRNFTVDMNKAREICRKNKGFQNV